MGKLTAALALLALVCSVTVAEARGGRTTADDCEAGSANPDCPDEPAPDKKPAPQSSPAPPPKSGK